MGITDQIIFLTVIYLAILIIYPTISEMMYFSSLPRIKKEPFPTYNFAFFTTEKNAVSTLQTIIRHVQTSGYRTDFFDREAGVLLLSKPFMFQLLTDGCMYRIQVIQRANSLTRVSVAITNKPIYFARTIARQALFLSEIEAAVFAAITLDELEVEQV